MTTAEILDTKLAALSITIADTSMLLEEVAYTITNYCNLTEVPDGLVFTQANMALDLARYENELSKTPADLDAADVDIDSISAVKIGDTNVTLGGNKGSVRTSTLRGHQIRLDNLLLDYKAQLNKFRKMVW
jgi:hypothetical protein